MPRQRSLNKHRKLIKNIFIKFILSRFETQLDNLCTRKSLEESISGYYSRRTNSYEIRINYNIFDFKYRFLLKFEFYRISSLFIVLRDYNRFTGCFKINYENALILKALTKENLLKPYTFLPE